MLVSHVAVQGKSKVRDPPNSQNRPVACPFCRAESDFV